MLWDLTDWKGKAEVKVEKHAEESEITKYFKSIFQLIKRKSHPVVNRKIWKNIKLPFQF